MILNIFSSRHHKIWKVWWLTEFDLNEIAKSEQTVLPEAYNNKIPYAIPSCDHFTVFIWCRKTKQLIMYNFVLSVGGANSLSSSRASSRCSDISEDPTSSPYFVRESETRVSGSRSTTTTSLKSKIPSLSRNSSIKKPKHFGDY